MSDVITVLLNGIFSFLFVFVLAKLLGKKQIAELSFTDYAIGISLGSIAAEWSTDVVNPWYFYAIAMAVFFVLGMAVTLLQRKTPFLKKVLHGSPIVIISDGKIDYQNLKKSKLDVNDVLGMCRAKGFFDTKDIAFAVLETSGDLSVLPKGSEKPTVVSDLDLPVEQASMTNYLILDGRVYNDGLTEIEKSESWLFERLGIKNKKDLKKFLLVSYDEKTDSFDVQTKNKQVQASETK